MENEVPLDHPLRKLFQGAVDKAFEEHREVYDPDVSAHIGDSVLPDFVSFDRLFRLKNATGSRIHDLPDMVGVSRENEGPERRLEVDRYIGDFVLFTVGFFPGSLSGTGLRSGQPLVSKVGKLLITFSQPLDYYVAEGRNAYHRAAKTARLFDPESQSTYQRLGANLEAYLDVVACVKKLIEEDPEFRASQAEW